jgi:hypothetical protein
LSSISGTFDKADYPAVKAAFIKMYGQPHQIDTPASMLAKAMARMSPEAQVSMRSSAAATSQDESGEFLVWQGNKAEIHLNLGRGDGNFVFSPNLWAKGVFVKADAVARMEVVEEPPIPPIPIEKLTKTLRVETSHGPVEFERGDLIDIGDLSYKFIQKGDEYEYSYTFDNSQVWLVVLGIDLDDQGQDDTIAEVEKIWKNWKQPRDWEPFPFGWSQALFGRPKENSVGIVLGHQSFQGNGNQAQGNGNQADHAASLRAPSTRPYRSHTKHTS